MDLLFSKMKSEELESVQCVAKKRKKALAKPPMPEQSQTKAVLAQLATDTSHTLDQGVTPKRGAPSSRA